MKPKIVNQIKVITAKWSGVTGNSYQTYILTNGKVRFTLNAFEADAVDSNTPLVADNWYHIVGTYSKTDQLIAIYINGIQDNTNSFSSSIDVGTTPLLIGDNSDGGFYFNGTTDEVRISATARSGDWIVTEYNNQHSPSTFYSVGVEETNGQPIPEFPTMVLPIIIAIATFVIIFSMSSRKQKR